MYRWLERAFQQIGSKMAEGPPIRVTIVERMPHDCWPAVGSFQAYTIPNEGDIIWFEDRYFETLRVVHNVSEFACSEIDIVVVCIGDVWDATFEDVVLFRATAQRMELSHDASGIGKEL